MLETSKKIKCPPSFRLANSLRFTSHTNQTAFGDLCDNSIDAECKLIKIRIGVVEGKGQILVADDGYGMDEEALIRAMTYGEHDDSVSGKIGRFGMGLKTAAGTLGNKFEVISRKESGPLMKAIWDYDRIAQVKDWEFELTPATSDDLSLFQSLLNSGSGTIIKITNLDYKQENNCHVLINQVKPYLGRTYRYFLTPTDQRDSNSGKIKIFVNEDQIFGLDPMERQAPNTRIVSQDLVLSDGRICETTVALLSDKDSGPNSDKDHGTLNFRANNRYQGVYVIRENREILAADAAVFEPLWGQKSDMLNYCRIELRYSDMDDIFSVNHDKCGIKDVAQGPMDILKRELSIHLSQARRERSILDTAKKETDELRTYHDAAGQIISSKASVLDLPPSTTHRRPGTGTKHPGTKQPKGTNERRGGKIFNPNSKLQKIKFETWGNGTARALFDFRTEKNTFIIRWNIDHDFYRKYISSDDTKIHVCAVNFMTFVLAAVLDKRNRESEPESQDLPEDFIQAISNDLGALSK